MRAGTPGYYRVARRKKHQLVKVRTTETQRTALSREKDPRVAPQPLTTIVAA
jgi:hypothetical protein